MFGTLCFEWEDGKRETGWLLNGEVGYDKFYLKNLDNLEFYP